MKNAAWYLFRDSILILKKLLEIKKSLHQPEKNLETDILNLKSPSLGQEKKIAQQCLKRSKKMIEAVLKELLKSKS